MSKLNIFLNKIKDFNLFYIWFSFNGKIGVMQFWLLGIIPILFVGYLLSRGDGFLLQNIIMVIALIFVITGFPLGLIIKRLRDINSSGLIIFPFLSIVLFVISLLVFVLNEVELAMKFKSIIEYFHIDIILDIGNLLIFFLLLTPRKIIKGVILFIVIFGISIGLLISNKAIFLKVINLINSIN